MPAASALVRSIRGASARARMVIGTIWTTCNSSAAATAECNDGTYSHAATHTGACSGHGGVKKFLK